MTLIVLCEQRYSLLHLFSFKSEYIDMKSSLFVPDVKGHKVWLKKNLPTKKKEKKKNEQNVF